MSYDFTMEIDTGGPKPYEMSDLDMNYTWNVGPMFRLALGSKEGVYVIQDKTGAESLASIDKMIDHMQDNPEKHMELNPANGWGSYEGALRVLQTLRMWAYLHPKAIFRIH